MRRALGNRLQGVEAGNEIYILISRERSRRGGRFLARSILDNGRFVECVHVALLRVKSDWGGTVRVRFMSTVARFQIQRRTTLPQNVTCESSLFFIPKTHI